VLSFLFHMHQPDYRHPATGVPIMPWVRLHATRGYRDVPRLILESGARVTVNLVPTLLEQIDRYAEGGSDVHLDLCARPAADLSAAEAAWFVEHALHGSPRAFGWFPGWGALRARRERGERFDVARLRDLQVWCNLAWFGATALAEWPELRALRQKGRDYSDDDKRFVLSVQLACVSGLRGLYARLPDVSATPYAHPILPLLVDTAHAARNLGDFPDPGFRFPEDASAQLREGRRIVETWVGRRVDGLWPSEGSVSPEVVELAAAEGFRWLVTDELVLARSVARGTGPVWQVGPLRALFRHHELSDRVGFVYADRDATDAVDDLLARARVAGEGRGGQVVVALDGENPWESYRDAGAGFLRELFARAPLETCGDLAAREPSGRVDALHTGSWIGADFRIWIGHEDDRAAWRLLRAVREAFAAHAPRAPDADGARRALWRAEASDWFWWYGPEFETPFAGEFDRLFRAHLAEALRCMGAPPMAELEHPLAASVVPGAAPTGPVHPERDDFFAWNAAGFLSLTRGAMAAGSGWPARLDYGFDPAGQLATRLVPPPGGKLAPGWRAEVEGGERLAVVLWSPDGARLPKHGCFILQRPLPRPSA
jgi:alpha-amylase/alpha-mannosidase (GH57 family)